MDGVGLVISLVAGLILSLTLGCVLGGLIVDQDSIGLSWLIFFIWFFIAVAGIFQLWGFLAYMLIAFEVVALLRVDSRRWLVLLTILVIQMLETIRMLLNYHDEHPWFQALAILGILLFPIIHFLLHYYLENRGNAPEAPYTDCRNCGYNLIGTLKARGTSCPECGEPISQYQLVRSVAEQRSLHGKIM